MKDMLKDKVAVVTGGAMGIGEAIVRAFIREGAKVVIADMNAAVGSALEAELTAAGAEALFVRTNVSSPEDTAACIKAAVEKFGALDIVVNNAGIVEQDVLLEDESVEEWNKVLSVNLTGQFLMCKAALPYLRETKGNIVNVASMSGLTATRYCAAYCASKAGVMGMTRAIAADYAKYGIRCNAICPAAVETPMMKNYFAAFTPEEVAEKISRLSGPIGRMSQPCEIAEAVVYLASPLASYVSGISMPVDGGYTAV